MGHVVASPAALEDHRAQALDVVSVDATVAVHVTRVRDESTLFEQEEPVPRTTELSSDNRKPHTDNMADSSVIPKVKLGVSRQNLLTGRLALATLAPMKSAVPATGTREIELQKAQQRVGWQPLGRLQWAVDFAQRELPDAIPAGELFDRQCEFVAFRRWAVPPGFDALDLLSTGDFGPEAQRTARHADRARVTALRGPAKSAVAMPLAFDSDTGLPGLPELRDIQSRWREVLGCAVHAKTTEWTPLLKDGFQIQPAVRHSGQLVVGMYFPQKDSTATVNLVLLLMGYCHLLRECKDDRCRRIFVLKRKGQQFHERTCQNRTAVRKFRDGLEQKPQRRGGRIAPC